MPEEIIRRDPSSGGYYWFPTRGAGAVTWSVLTCHDLGFGAEVWHFSLWPSVIDRLAEAWGLDREALARDLSRHYTGLPRGRVTEPHGRFRVCHGNDAPVGNWKARVCRAFGLVGIPLRADFDDVECMVEEHRCKVEAALGIAIGRGGGATRGNQPGERDG